MITVHLNKNNFGEYTRTKNKQELIEFVEKYRPNTDD